MEDSADLASRFSTMVFAVVGGNRSTEVVVSSLGTASCCSTANTVAAFDSTANYCFVVDSSFLVRNLIPRILHRQGSKVTDLQFLQDL